jgi:hypothetical protein
MTSANDGWIVGQSTANGTTPLLLHYTHGAWTAVANPLSAADSMNISFERVQMRTSTDGWIILGTGVNFQQSDTLRYDGTKWQVARLPINPDSEAVRINSIAMTSADDGWAVGDRVTSNANLAGTANAGGDRPDPTLPLLLQFQNGAWNVYHP